MGTQVEEKKRGRPLLITPQVAIRICELVASGMSLRKIGRLPALPSKTCITRTIHVDAQFAAQYHRARLLKGDTYFDKAIEVADATLEGTYDPNAARVAIGAYQWAAGKLHPAEYGDNARIDVEVNLNDHTRHAPDWMKPRLAAPVVDVEAEVIDPDTAPEPANTANPLLANIADAAAE